MTDKTARVLPASRQPVTPEHPASATGSATAPDYDPGPAGAGHEAGPPTGNPVFPVASAAAAGDADAPSRTATFEDAERFAGGTQEMHRERFGGDTLDDTTTFAPVGSAIDVDSDRDLDDGGRHRLIDLDRGRETGVGAPLETASSSSATTAPAGDPPADGFGGTGGGASVLVPASDPATTSGLAGSTPAAPPLAPVAAPVGDPEPRRDERPRGESRRDERPRDESDRDQGRRAGTSPAPATRSPEPRSAEDIERDIEATRRRLAGTIDEISDRVKPANVAERGKSSARALVMDERGNLRMERIRPAVGVVVGLLVLSTVRRWRRRRRAR
ncbi:MAG: DUF3618 domain-containing protein [Actinomycetota bacterium]|nr:DUF3618 domain-containing protein [Actinomycetota bacterium]